jgi:hypothetical protein
VNFEGPVIKEVPYEKEPECAKLTSSISLAPKFEPARTSMNTEESDPHMTRVQITQCMCTYSNSSKKKKGTEIQQLYQPPVSPALKTHVPNTMNDEDQAIEYDQVLKVSSYS